MNFDGYQEEALKTNLYPAHLALYALSLGLASEAGEVAGLMKRVARDWGGSLTPEARERLEYELGDVMWYIAVLAAEANIKLSDVVEHNIEKLRDRAVRNALHGEGDKR